MKYIFLFFTLLFAIAIFVKQDYNIGMIGASLANYALYEIYDLKDSIKNGRK